MILKLKVNGRYGESWELISDVTSIRHSRISKEQRQDPKLFVNDYIQAFDELGKVDESLQTYEYIQAWHKRNLDPINIITNMPVYLLNDEGKTIERIN